MYPQHPFVLLVLRRNQSHTGVLALEQRIQALLTACAHTACTHAHVQHTHARTHTRTHAHRTPRYGGLHRLVTVELPFPLLQMARTLLFTWVFTIPFVLERYMGLVRPLCERNVEHCKMDFEAGLIGAQLSPCFTFFMTYSFIGLEFTAVELDDPFGDDANDIDVERMYDTRARAHTRAHAQTQRCHALLEEIGMALREAETASPAIPTDHADGAHRRNTLEDPGGGVYVRACVRACVLARVCVRARHEHAHARAGVCARLCTRCVPYVCMHCYVCTVQTYKCTVCMCLCMIVCTFVNSVAGTHARAASNDDAAVFRLYERQWRAPLPRASAAVGYSPRRDFPDLPSMVAAYPL